MIDYPDIEAKFDLKKSFIESRALTESLCQSLELEDYSVQPIDFVSPPKWHLAHTTWFFEQFVLVQFKDNYTPYSDDFSYLFNSYYNNKGDRVLRPNRGNMTRPTVKEVMAYRKAITSQILSLMEEKPSDQVSEIIEIGIHHEQQHQELLVYDIKYILGHQPTCPKVNNNISLQNTSPEINFIQIDGGLVDIGHKEEGFSFDNELGAHKVYLQPYEISDRLVTNQEFLEFIDDGGYNDFNLWHADGWDWVKQFGIQAPMYWHKKDSGWYQYSFNGIHELRLNEPVSHISFYEAFAFAEWRNMRLPTEFEWEASQHLFNWGQLWEWTHSAYLPYPNFKTAEGALGEYNGKFMVNQMVLRGSSIATPKGHERYTYRNFFQPDMRWMFSGIRLVK